MTDMGGGGVRTTELRLGQFAGSAPAIALFVNACAEFGLDLDRVEVAEAALAEYLTLNGHGCDLVMTCVVSAERLELDVGITGALSESGQVSRALIASGFDETSFTVDPGRAHLHGSIFRSA